MNISFIGLGHMGAPMARNLIKAGHALCGELMSSGDPVHRISIVPRGRALGRQGGDYEAGIGAFGQMLGLAHHASLAAPGV